MIIHFVSMANIVTFREGESKMIQQFEKASFSKNIASFQVINVE
jgi:hypothetical protein